MGIKKNKIIKRCDDEISWIKSNQEASIDQFKYRKRQLEDFYVKM